MIQMAEPEPSLLDGLLARPVDFSARTRLICGDVGSIDNMLLPERIAWDLFRPQILARLQALDEKRSFMQLVDLVDQRHELGWTALDAVAAQAWILLELPDGPWPLVARRPRISRDLAVSVHRDLMALAGWGNLGEAVRLFGLHTRSALYNAARLAPSRLRAHQPGTEQIRGVEEQKRQSVFNVAGKDLLSEFILRATLGACLPLTVFDLLVAGLYGAIVD